MNQKQVNLEIFTREQDSFTITITNKVLTISFTYL